MNLFIKIVFYFFLLFVISANAQDVKCNFCKKPIVGKYIIVDDIPYHKNHFKCANCNKPIVGKYNKKNGKYYDNNCFIKLFSLRCSICNEPIEGKYFTDNFGLKYHAHHESEIDRCDNCNRVISERTTRGGVKYSDGRNICNICYGKKHTSISGYKNSLNKVIDRLNNYRLTFNLSTITLKPVDLIVLQQVSGIKYSKNIKGFTFTNIRILGNEKTFTHIIYVLNGIPKIYAEATIAHELMHVWINENIEHKLSDKLEEGSCNYITYTYLKSDYSEDAKDIIKQLHNNPDKIYGDGFRKVYNRFRGRDFNLFLNFLRENKTF